MLLTFDKNETEIIKNLKVGEAFQMKVGSVRREPKTLLLTIGLLKIRFSTQDLEKYKEIRVQVK